MAISIERLKRRRAVYGSLGALDFLINISEKKLAQSNKSYTIPPRNAKNFETSNFAQDKKLPQNSEKFTRTGIRKNLVLNPRSKLFELGFTERPLRELTEAAKSSLKDAIRFDAACELAIWHIKSETIDEYKIALDWINYANHYAEDDDSKSRLLTLKLLIYYYTQQYDSGLKVFNQAIAIGKITPDQMLLIANFEGTVEGRVNLINQVLTAFGIESVSLLPNKDLLPYDRLTCAANLPRITNGPKVTVLIAAYNSANTLPTALRSLQEQTWQNLEIIVIDDASPNTDMANILLDFTAADKRIRMLRLKENAGAYIARNLGLDFSTGDFVTLHDADDWSHPKKIETQVRFMISNPKVIGCTTQQARANNALYFDRKIRRSLIITNVSSFMFRREIVREKFGYWDTVRLSADNELIRRIRAVYGKNAVFDLVTGPLSFQRNSSDSMVADEALGVSGLLHGARRQYLELQTQYHSSDSAVLKYTGNPFFRPFPAPKIMSITKPDLPRNYDVIIASDFSFPGGTTSSNAEEIKAQARLGLRTGLVEICRYTNAPRAPMNPKIVELLVQRNVDLISYGDSVSCDLLIIRQPMVLEERQRYLPHIEANNIHIIINQTPKLYYPSDLPGEYSLTKVHETVREMFGVTGKWFPIGPLVRSALKTYHADELKQINLSTEDWRNIIDVDYWSSNLGPRKRNGRLRVGRHSRDSEVKWPEFGEVILQCYPASDEIEVWILGGAETPRKIIKELPRNWTVYEFGQLLPRDFLKEIDVWIYFSHSRWIESFGRAILEAIAAGVPVILPEIYRPLFGESALYSTPEDAMELAKTLHADTIAYNNQINIAHQYVINNFSYNGHFERLKNYGVRKLLTE